LRIKAKIEIGENDELIPDQIAQVRDIITADDNVKTPPKQFDQFFLRCLRAKKYDIDRAAKTYKKLCRLHHTCKELTEFLIPSHYADFLRKHFVCILRNRDASGRQILFVQPQNWNAYKFCLDEALAALFMVIDESLESIDTQLNGLVVLVDFKGFGFAHARQVGPSRIQAVVGILQDSYPARFKEIHFYNHPSLFNMIFAVAKPFLKEKMRKRIYFHGHDITSVQKSFGSSLLPEYLGGILPDNDYANHDLTTRLLKRDDHFKDMRENFVILS